ncbi:precorrin-3B synthase [Hyphomicrobium sp. xq]|uniref:Precorrin-3B synthase n=1 Tax=Hyphomicrobium album TaxID=2665159 RepID=A0A6I3KGH7_9HYPH|nr:precorrin-3B synthase [Hyphomicrobium album]MTD94755.1 precorrin-3B synthase [Hyphomicrobium album]
MIQPIPRIDPFSVRGWCPSSARPMQTGDGLIVRVSPRGRSLSTGDLAAIADIAERHGNGLIDLTRRANIQLRGITERSLPHVWQELTRIGLLGAETANILVGPLAGVDAHEIVDARRLADALEAAVVGNPSIAALPDKFSFVVDGGGRLPLDDVGGDMCLRAVRIDGNAVVALTVDRPGGTRLVANCAVEDAAAVAADLAARYLRLRPHTGARMRDVPEGAVDALLADARLRAIDMPSPRPAQHPLGPVRIGGDLVAVGLAAAFGRLASDEVHGLADCASRSGIAAFRVSPWRSLYALTDDDTAARALTTWSAAAGLITDTHDPLHLIDACPGTSGCSSASVDTRLAARALAPSLRALGVSTCHVSGCSKGCARSTAADLTLVGASGTFAVIHQGTARSAPSRFVHPGDLASHPHLLKPV